MTDSGKSRPLLHHTSSSNRTRPQIPRNDSSFGSVHSNASSDRLSAPPSPIDPSDPLPFRAKTGDRYSLKQVPEQSSPSDDFIQDSDHPPRVSGRSTCMIHGEESLLPKTSSPIACPDRLPITINNFQTPRPTSLASKDGHACKDTILPMPDTILPMPDTFSSEALLAMVDNEEDDNIIPVVPLSESPSREVPDRFIPEDVAKEFEDFEIAQHLIRSHTHSGIVVPREIRLRRASSKYQGELSRRNSFGSAMGSKLGRPVAVRQSDDSSGPISQKGSTAGTAVTHAYVHNFLQDDDEDNRRSSISIGRRSRSMTLQVVRSRDSVYEVIWEDEDSITPSMAPSFSRSVSSSSCSDDGILLAHRSYAASVAEVFGPKTKLTKWSWGGELGPHSSPDLRRATYIDSPPRSRTTSRRATVFATPPESQSATRRPTMYATPPESRAGTRRGTVCPLLADTGGPRRATVYMTPPDTPSTRHTTIYWTPQDSISQSFDSPRPSFPDPIKTPYPGSPTSSLDTLSIRHEDISIIPPESFDDDNPTPEQASEIQSFVSEETDCEPSLLQMPRRVSLTRPPGSPYLGGSTLSPQSRRDLLGKRKVSGLTPEEDHFTSHRDSLVLTHQRIFRDSVEHDGKPVVNHHDVRFTSDEIERMTQVQRLKKATWHRFASSNVVESGEKSSKPVKTFMIESGSDEEKESGELARARKPDLLNVSKAKSERNIREAAQVRQRVRRNSVRDLDAEE